MTLATLATHSLSPSEQKQNQRKQFNFQISRFYLITSVLGLETYVLCDEAVDLRLLVLEMEEKVLIENGRW